MDISKLDLNKMLLNRVDQNPPKKEMTEAQKLDFDELKLKKYKEMLQEEETNMRKVAAEVVETEPYKRPCKNCYATEHTFRQLYQKERASYEDDSFLLKTNYVTADRYSCLTHISKLKSINLSDMMVNKIHNGFYLECKTITDPFYVSGMHILVMDINNDIEHVVLYNYDSKNFNDDPKFLMPKGTRLAIKEPHLQILGLNSNDFGIRVDSQTNIVIQSYPESTSTKSIETFIEEGNKAFTRTEYNLAIRYYSQAIERSKQTSLRAYSNRSQSYLKIEKYYAAYQDAKEAARLDATNQKAYFRMGKSAYMMRKYEMALESFETCMKLNPKNAEAEIELKKTQDRIHESKTGVYDFKALYEQFFKKENFYMDIAEYRSNLIQVTDIPNKAKGVIAKESIPKGTLIVVSKAAAATFHNQIDYRKKSYITIDYLEGNYNAKDQSQNVATLAYKMHDDPDFAEQVYAMYAGPGFNRDKVEHPLIDIKRIEGILEFNSFQILNSFESLQLIELNKVMKAAKRYNETEFKELDYVIPCFDSEDYVNLTKLQIKFNNLDKQCGFWIFPAFFNHACVSNCIMDFIGDVMTIHTLRDVQKGEELCIRYFPPEIAFSQREEYTMNKFKFKCDCILCNTDRNDPVRLQRDQLFYQIVTKNAQEQISFNDALSDVQKMRSTYTNRLELQQQMITPLFILANKYRNVPTYKKSAKCFEEIFDITKDSNDFISVAVLKEAATDYQKCSNAKKVESCRQKALDYFLGIYPNFPCFDKLWEAIIFIGFNFVF